GADGHCRRSARLGRKCWEVDARRSHQAARDTDQRLLRQLARYEHAMAAVYTVQWLWNRVRGTRPEDEPGQVDRHPCRSDLRFALSVARPGRSLCLRRLEAEVCERLRGGMGQGDGERSVRCGLRPAE